MTSLPLVLWIVAQAAAPSPSLPAPVATVTDAERARLDRGEVIVTSTKVPGTTVPMSTARAIIDAPPERVWPLVWDCGRYEDTMPSIASAELVKRDGLVTTCRVVADLPFPFQDLLSVTRAVLTEEPGVRYHRQWTLIEGDYTVNQGSWTLLPWGEGKTLAIYRLDARPKIALPDWMLERIQKDRLPEVMARLRKNTARP